MSKQILISVVMPVYNGEPYLDEAIQSILNQTYKNFEFIIINDGSTDKSLEIINHYKKSDNRIVLISRENKGLVYSLNEGINQAKGQFIARMDADDVSLPQRFEKQINFMQKYNIDLCGTHWFIVDESSKYLDARVAPLSLDAILIQLVHTTPFAHGSVMIRKEVVLKYMYGSTKYPAIEDYALWIEMFNNGVKFGNVNKFLFKYRDFQKSFSKSKAHLMDKERFKLSKEFIFLNQDKIKDAIDFQLNTKLSKIEEIFLMKVALQLKYKIKEVYKKISKMNSVIALIKYLKD